MSQKIQAVRGMNDVLPKETAAWQSLEALLRAHLHAFAYQEIRLPVVEKTALFQRSVGEVTDIVEKEMYTFEDRNGERLSLRPEGTAGCVRAGIEHGLLYNQIQRLWYIGPLFRHERPQKGRYRQFYQLGVEAFGMPGAEIDIELLALCASLWRALAIETKVRLEINTLGSFEARHRYRDALVMYLDAHREALDEDSRRRLDKNPLRILDTKNPEMQAIIAGAPILHDYLDAPSRTHFETVCRGLDALGIQYTIKPTLVRGLDYYCHTVFEWVTDDLGAQGTVCAGGRYDGLVAQLGGKATPAIGFAAGLERLLSLLPADLAPKAVCDAYLVTLGEPAFFAGMLLAERLRDQAVRVMMDCTGGSLKAQLKKADASGAGHALVIGEDELARAVVLVKSLRNQASQVVLPLADTAGLVSCMT